MIAIVNYGCGNLQAIANIYKRLGIPVTLASTASELQSADRIILPGVGAFDWAMKRLNDSGMRDTLDAAAASKPILGICVGMQMMAESSEDRRRIRHEQRIGFVINVVLFALVLGLLVAHSLAMMARIP